MRSFLYEQFYMNIEAEIPSQKTKTKTKKKQVKACVPYFLFFHQMIAFQKL